MFSGARRRVNSLCPHRACSLGGYQHLGEAGFILLLFFASIFLYFIPTSILGMISPYSVRLMVDSHEHSGHMAGQLFSSQPLEVLAALWRLVSILYYGST